MVTAASGVAASGTGARAIGPYCLVTGKISPVDTTAPDIQFRVALPETWNSKVVMFGGGGFDGSIPSVVGNVPAGPADQLLPIGRGYATFASDSGHQAGALGSQDNSFGLNDEALRNFGGDAIKKTRDAAVFLIKARYAVDSIQKAYFAGGSTGGREAIAAITRWPADWDGAISWYPAWNDAAAILGGQRVNRALAQPGAYPSVAKRQLSAHGGIAGVRRPRRRRRRPDQQPAALQRGVRPGDRQRQRQSAALRRRRRHRRHLPVRCADHRAEGDEHRHAASTIALASGEDHYPGYNVWGADLGITTNPSPLEPTVTFLALGTSQPALPMPRTAPYISVFLDQWIQYSVTRSPGYDTLSFDPENPGPWASRLSELSTQLDTKVDLSAFHAKGGKLLLAHGTVRRPGEHARHRGVLPAAAEPDESRRGRHLRPLLRSARATVTPRARRSTPPGIR